MTGLAQAALVIASGEVSDLGWLFSGAAAAALGEQSNFTAMVAMIQLGPGSNSSPPSADAGVDRAAAVERARRIEAALGQLGALERMVLARVFADEDWPDVSTWGAAAPTAALTLPAERGHERELARTAMDLDPQGCDLPDSRQKAVIAHPHLASVEAWLVALAKRARSGKGTPGDRQRVADIKAAGEGLVTMALGAYARAARGRR